MKESVKTICVILVLAALFTTGCATVPKNEGERQVLKAKVDSAITEFKERDPGIQRFFNESYGYAVYPRVAKGAFWLGGARGKGIVYEQGSLIGYSTLNQATIGFSFGGEFFREIIFFQNKQDLDDFTIANGEYTFSAQATALALRSGVARKATYQNGMAVFIIAEKGLMVDASVGGQKFTYVPVSKIRD